MGGNQAKPESLRERQKRKSREEMLATALKLFSERGFEQTTMNDIAAEVMVGTATLFRYFSSKIGILAALVMKDVEEALNDGWKVVNNPPDSPQDGARELLLASIAFIDKPSKKIRSAKINWSGVHTGIREIDEVVEWSDAEARKQILELLRHYRDRGKILADCPLEDLAEIIFAIFNQYYIEYSLAYDGRRKSKHRKLIRLVYLAMQSWVVDD